MNEAQNVRLLKLASESQTESQFPVNPNGSSETWKRPYLPLFLFLLLPPRHDVQLG
jgi:hypothetical protein